MDLPELSPWKVAMLVIVPLMTRGPKLRAWLAVFASSVLAIYAPEWAAQYLRVSLLEATPPTYLAIDLICGALVLAKPAGVAQKTIGTIFAIMAIIDAGYILSPQADRGIDYYWIMLTLGWVQFAVLAVWGSYDAGTYLSRRLGLAGRAVASGSDIR